MELKRQLEQAEQQQFEQAKKQQLEQVKKQQSEQAMKQQLEQVKKQQLEQANQQQLEMLKQQLEMQLKQLQEKDLKQYQEQIPTTLSYSEHPQSKLQNVYSPVLCPPVPTKHFVYPPPPPTPLPSSDMILSPRPVGVVDSYAKVTQMLDALHLTEILPMFKAAMIKVCICVYTSYAN